MIKAPRKLDYTYCDQQYRDHEDTRSGAAAYDDPTLRIHLAGNDVLLV